NRWTRFASRRRLTVTLCHRDRALVCRELSQTRSAIAVCPFQRADDPTPDPLCNTSLAMLEACQCPPARLGCVDELLGVARSDLHPPEQLVVTPPPSFGLPQCLSLRQPQTDVARPCCLGCSVTMCLCRLAECGCGAQAHSHRPARWSGQTVEPERELWRKGE